MGEKGIEGPTTFVGVSIIVLVAGRMSLQMKQAMIAIDIGLSWE